MVEKIRRTEVTMLTGVIGETKVNAIKTREIQGWTGRRRRRWNSIRFCTGDKPRAEEKSHADDNLEGRRMSLTEVVSMILEAM